MQYVTGLQGFWSDGVLERDADDCMDAGGRAAPGAVAENSCQVLESGDDDMTQLQGDSIIYGIAVGPQQGCNVFLLQML